MSDYVVICGMPLFWSHREPDGTISSTVQHASWPSITGWLCPEKRMIIAGFGIFLLCPETINDYQVAQPEIVAEIQKLFDRCLLVYSRSTLAKNFWPAVESLVCPSVLALPKPSGPKELKLCNFMPGGSHYPGLAKEASECMTTKMPGLAKELIASGYHFVAHSAAEYKLALDLGWPKGAIFAWKEDGTGDKLMDVYARCAKYIGNRIHGGIMARAAGADVTVIGYDTRLWDIWRMGGQGFTPSQLPDLTDWIRAPAKSAPFDIDRVRKAHLSWWSTKLRLKIRE